MQIKTISKLLLPVLAASVLAGCQVSGNQYRSDVYSASAVNQAQAVASVNLIAIYPAQIRVPNADQESIRLAGTVLGTIAGVVIGNQSSSSRQTARIAGGAIGGMLGNMASDAMYSDDTVVEGVQLVYRLPNGQLLQSTQVGRLCEYQLGPAIMVMPAPGQTRIQPNRLGGCGVQ